MNYPVRPWVAVIFLPELACTSGGNPRPNWVDVYGEGEIALSSARAGGQAELQEWIFVRPECTFADFPTFSP